MRVSLRTIRLVASVAFLASAAGLPPLAQTTPTAAPFQNQFPDPVRYKAPIPEAAELRLGEVTEIPLNGPLYSGPVLVQGQVEIRTAQGAIRLSWSGRGWEPQLDASAPPAELTDELPWASSPDGTHRAKPANESLLVLQKICHGCDSGWRRGWRLRVAGLAQVPPLLTQRRVYYGASDNRVYSVKRKNGHRVWATPLDGRVTRPIALWVDPQGPPEGSDLPVAALLIVPEPGVELIVLDSLGGRPALRYRLRKEGDRVVGAPLSLPDGYVVLARQGYSDDDASLLLLKVLRSDIDPDQAGESGVTGYNPPTSSEADSVPAR